MSVSAIIVTRGDVELGQVLASFPPEWETIVWDNSGRITIREREYPKPMSHTVEIPSYFGGDPIPDLAVYGRYAAIEYAKNDLIYVQDDDCVLSDPQAIVQAYREQCPVVAVPEYDEACWFDGVVCNMPANFRARHFYDEHSLVGFGACFHRDAPKRAFERFIAYHSPAIGPSLDSPWVLRTCDIVFTALTPRVLVDVPYEDMPWASADNRMWKQPTHQAERDKMLDLVLKVRNS